jgi:hypothetical protein
MGKYQIQGIISTVHVTGHNTTHRSYRGQYKKYQLQGIKQKYQIQY